MSEPSGAIRGVPGQLSSFVGRETEVEAVVALLRRPDVRLVTLTGPGGIGKTRLAVAAASLLRADFPSGVDFVSLAAIRDPALFLATINQQMGVHQTPELDSRQALIAALGNGTRLLILDNLEQLRAAATEITVLLTAAPGLKVLATSRGRLQLRGEHEFPVPTLLPESGVSFAGNPANDLFMQRAREVQPDFMPSPDDLTAISEICRRLDGLPLAIELAAARIRVLPPVALLARLDRRLPLLTGGARDLPDRQRTMRDAIRWSYDLLDPGEQQSFRALATFAGGFTLAEAEALLPEVLPLDGIEALIDNGLLLRRRGEGEPRFRFLETLREFGQEELEASGEAGGIRNRHADYFTEFAEAALVRLRGAERTSWLERLEAGHDNLRAAFIWSVESGNTLRALRLTGALWQFWWWKSHIAEGRHRLAVALAMPGGLDAGAVTARALTGAGALAETQGDYAEAERFHEAAVRIWHDLSDSRGLATSLLFRWLVAFNSGDQPRMSNLAQESFRLFSDLGDPWGIAMSQMEMGVQAMLLRENDRAEEVIAISIAGFRAIGDTWGIAICQGVSGNVAIDRGDYATAAATLRESLSTLLVLDDLWGVATILPAAARLAADQGQLERAVTISGAVQQLHRTMNAPLKVPFRERYERNLEIAHTKLGSDQFARALSRGLEMTPTEAVLMAVTPPTATSSAEPTGFANLAIPLSPREREVLRLFPGRTMKQIAQALFVSESTVRTHIEHIYSKLGVRNQKELISYIYEHDLI